jgi:hypothetical protein
MSTPSTPSAGIPEHLLVQNFARPAGVSLLDAMTHQHCKDTGRKSYLPASTAAKIEGKPAPVSSNPPHGVANQFDRFLQTGQHAAIYQQRDTKALLDMARSVILHMAENKSAAASAKAATPKPTAAPSTPSTPSAAKPTAPTAPARATAPAKPITATKGRTGEQFLALSPEDAAAINKTCCFADRSGELRAELQKALEAMPAGENRSKFYQRFKGAFQAASGFIAKK